MRFSFTEYKYEMFRWKIINKNVALKQNYEFQLSASTLFDGRKRHGEMALLWICNAVVGRH